MRGRVVQGFVAVVAVLCGVFPSPAESRNREPCISRGGECKSRAECTAPSATQPSLCPDDPSSVMCCLPPQRFDPSASERREGDTVVVLQDQRCDTARGSCMLENECRRPDYTRAGLCPGPSGVKCCIDMTDVPETTVAAINLTPFLNGYIRLGETSADAAVAKAIATVNAFADTQKAQHASEPWRFERIMAENLRRAVPKVTTWASERTREAFKKIREILKLPDARYYVTVEKPRLEHMDLSDVSLAQEGSGFKLTASVAFQGRFDIVVRRENPPPRQEFLRFTVLLERPLSFRTEVRVGVTGPDGAGPPNVAVSFAFGADTDAALNLRIVGEASIGADGFAAVGAKFTEMRSKLLELARGAHRWHSSTREGGWKTLFGRLDAEVRDIASAVTTYVHTDKDLATKTFGEIVGSARVRDLRDRIVRAAMPHVETAIRTALTKDAAKPALAFLAKPVPREESQRLHFTLRRALMNRAFLLSDFGAQLQALVIRHFLVDINGIELAIYEWREKEKTMGGPLATLDACARASCGAGHGGAGTSGAHMCGTENLINYKAINTLMYRSPKTHRVPSGQSRRVCFEGKAIPAVLTPGTNLNTLNRYCCAVEASSSGRAGRPALRAGACDNKFCTGKDFPMSITSVVITYGGDSEDALTGTERRRCERLVQLRRVRSSSDCPPVHRPIPFSARSGRTGSDIAGDRWWARRTTMHARREVPTGTTVTDIKFAWHDQGERCPPGYETIQHAFGGRKDGSLTQGPGTRRRGFKELYACVLYGAMGPSTVTRLELVYGNRTPPSPGFEIIRNSVGKKQRDRNLWYDHKSANFNFGRWDDDDEAVFLAVRRASADGIPTVLDPVSRYGERDEHWSDAENAAGGGGVVRNDGSTAPTRSIRPVSRPSTSTSTAPTRSLRPVARPARDMFLELSERSKAMNRASAHTRSRAAELEAARTAVVAESPSTRFALMFNIMGTGGAESKLWVHTVSLSHVALNKFKLEYLDQLPGGTQGTNGLVVSFGVEAKINAHVVLEGVGGMARTIGTWGRKAQDHDLRLTSQNFPDLATDNILYNTMDEDGEPAHGDVKLGGTLHLSFDKDAREWQARIASLAIDRLELDTKNAGSAWIVRATLGIAEGVATAGKNVLPWLAKKLDDVVADLGVGDQFGDEFTRLKGSGAKLEVDLSFRAPPRLFEDKVIQPIYDAMHDILFTKGLAVGKPLA